MPLEAPKCDECKNLPIQFVCPKCEESYCGNCDEKLHNRSQKFKEHKRHVYTGMEKIGNRFCLIKGHEDVTISLLCFDCNKLICSNCLLKDHKSHTTGTLKEGVEKVLEHLKKQIAPVLENTKRVENEIEKKRKN